MVLQTKEAPCANLWVPWAVWADFMGGLGRVPYVCVTGPLGKIYCTRLMYFNIKNKYKFAGFKNVKIQIHLISKCQIQTLEVKFKYTRL